MKEQHIPVGIYNTEIFIARVIDGKPYRTFDNRMTFDVIRPVSVGDLEHLRDPDYRMEDYEDLWREAVRAGRTVLGLEDWFNDIWGEEFDETDPEDFLGKDDSDTQYLGEEDRRAAEKFLENEYGLVGTWESAGWYSPNGKFDFVFDNPLAKEIAKEFEDSLK